MGFSRYGRLLGIKCGLIMLGLLMLPCTGSAQNESLDLSGTWIDQRTGADFMDIEGTQDGFSFTAYGGSLNQPRYMSKGVAIAHDDSSLIASARDLPDQCCGAQGRLVFRVLSAEQMEVSSFWWPQNQADPGNPAAEPHLLIKSGQAAIEQTAGLPASRPETPAPAPQPAPVLLRLYNAALKIHAYAVTSQEVQDLSAQGYQLSGTVVRLLLEENGAAILWGYRQSADAPMTLLGLADTLPPGFAQAEPLGRIQLNPEAGLSALYGAEKLPAGGSARQDYLATSRRDQLAYIAEAGYGAPLILGYALPENEPPLQLPLAADFNGSWTGDGWGRFFVLQEGSQIHMFWYYSDITGPHFFGSYNLVSADGKAKGLAVGQPGAQASFYEHSLTFMANSSPPRIQVDSLRIAAPLDDGRLVRFLKPQPASFQLTKAADFIPKEQSDIMQQWFKTEKNQPLDLYTRATEQAQSLGRLLER